MLLKLAAKLFSTRPVRERLIARAQRTPYYHLQDKGDVYMYRWWLFNASRADGTFRWPRLPSIRIHRIMRRDLDRHLHDHPADCRTFVLHGWYMEKREGGFMYTRAAGQTARIDFGEYHTITEVPVGGVWTMFVMGPRKGMWGFLVNGKKVPFRQYFAERGSEI